MSPLLSQGWSPEPEKTFPSVLAGSCEGPCSILVRELPTQVAQWAMFPMLGILTACYSHLGLQWEERSTQKTGCWLTLRCSFKRVETWEGLWFLNVLSAYLPWRRCGHLAVCGHDWSLESYSLWDKISRLSGGWMSIRHCPECFRHMFWNTLSVHFELVYFSLSKAHWHRYAD